MSPSSSSSPSSSPTSSKKRPRDTPSPFDQKAVIHISSPPPPLLPTPPPPANSPPPPPPPQQQQQRQKQPQTDDLLTRLPPHDWEPFTQRLNSTLQSSSAEVTRLADEYHMWSWMYDIWATSRNEDETRRLSREMATVIRWTKIKEEELERSREEHTKSMLAISSVLGIVPKSPEPI